jgi:isoquinoline 1-oxidoreductase subunit beta
MTTFPKTSRRNFLKIAATAGGGLLIGFHWNSADASAMKVVGSMADDVNFNSYLSISPEGVITLRFFRPTLN